MGKTVGQHIAQAVEVVLERGTVSSLLFRFGFQSTDGGLKSLDVLPQGAVLLLVLRRCFPQLPQLCFSD